MSAVRGANAGWCRAGIMCIWTITKRAERNSSSTPALLSMLTHGWRFLLIAFFVIGISGRSNEVIDYRDFAIDTYYPKPNEIRLAEERARKFWAKNAGRYGSNPVYLAVETSKLFESEIVQDLWPKLINSKTTTTFFAGSPGNRHNEVDLKGIMIFDTRTGHFAGNRGFISVDTPQRGGVARFGNYIARFIGTGRWR